MSRKRCLLALLISVCTAAAAAETPPLTAQQQRWLEREALHVISEREKAVFLSLETTRARTELIRQFWDARDPDPDTRDNERRKEHLRRVDEADRLFGVKRKVDGWATSRGRVYIIFGAPIERLRYPADGARREIEDWLFRAPPESAFPPFFHALFVRVEGEDDFRLYDPATMGPAALFERSAASPMDRRAALQRLAKVSPGLARVSMSLAPGAAPPYLPGLGVDPVFARIVDYQNRPDVDVTYVDAIRAREAELARAGTGDGEPTLPPALELDGFLHGAFAGGGGGALHYSLVISPDSLTLTDEGGRVTGRLLVTGVITPVGSRRPVRTIEESIIIDLTPDQFARVRSYPFAYQDILPMMPGTYDVRMMVRSLDSARTGQIAAEVEIPAYARHQLTMSPVLLFSQEVPAQVAARRPFGFGEHVFNPAAAGPVLASMGDLRAVFQVAYPVDEIEPGTKLRVSYVVEGAAGDVLAGFDRLVVEPATDGGIAVGRIRTGLRGMPPGAYRLRVTIAAAGRKVTQEVAFAVAPEVEEIHPWVYIRQGRRTPGLVALDLGRQALAAGQGERASDLLAAALDDEQAGADARLFYAASLLAQDDAGSAATVIAPLAAAGDVQALALLASARFGLGEPTAAVAAYSAALEISPRSTRLLNGRAQAAIEAGDRAQGVESLRRSLELDPDQPRMSALLASLVGDQDRRRN